MNAGNVAAQKRFRTKEETGAFLRAYQTRRDEFLDVKKRKHAMQNVLENLIAEGVLTQPTTVEMLQVKLKNLLRAYKTSKDNQKRTGAAPCVALFEEIMEEIFGTDPIISNQHTINLSGEPTQALLEVYDESNLRSSAASDTSSQTTHTPKKMKAIKQKYLQDKLMLKKEMNKEKLTVLKDYIAAKLQRQDAREKAKRKRHVEKLEVLRELKQKN